MTSYRLIDHVSPVIVPENSSLRRSPPRRPDQFTEGYIEKFDATTVVYDAFWQGADVWLCCPPLRELEALLPKRVAERRLLDRMEWVKLDGASGVSVSPDRRYLFAGRRALVTISKDNPIEWIRDWVRFHVDRHGVDAALFYDNGSLSYTPDDIVAALAPLVELLVVVPWPFKWGPRGAPPNAKRKRSDSNYCQMAMLEHARRRYLSDAAGVLNCDVDELIVTADGRSLFDHLEEQASGVLLMNGRWVVVSETEAGALPRHRDFRFLDPMAKPTNPKWAAMPRQVPQTSQWMIHRVGYVDAPASSAVELRHFRALNTHWKDVGARTQVQAHRARWIEDERLRDDLRAAFG